jgi:hypothetical protein
VSQLKTGVAVFSALIFGASAARGGGPNADRAGREMDPMDVMMQIHDESFASNDDRLSEQESHSKEFKNWTDHFAAGDLKAAEKDWGDVMVATKKLGVNDCSHLNCLANERTVMLDSKTSVHLIWQHLYDATLHKLGEHDAFTAVCLKYLAMQAEGARDFVRAANYRKKQVAILEDKFGKTSTVALQANKWLKSDISAAAAKKHKP